MGAGLHMDPGDIAFKSNFATLDEDSGIVTSRRADRRFEDLGPVLCADLDGERCYAMNSCTFEACVCLSFGCCKCYSLYHASKVRVTLVFPCGCDIMCWKNMQSTAVGGRRAAAAKLSAAQHQRAIRH